MTRDRTLVVHTGGIGDFLLACPALEFLAQTASVDVMGRPERLALAQAAGIAERGIDIDRSGFESLLSEPSDEIRALLTEYSRAFVFMKDDDGALREAIAGCGVGEVSCFPGLPSADWGQHASAYYLDCVGAEAKPTPFRLNVQASCLSYDVLMHPGSGGARKNWALERFLELGRRLESKGRRVAWIAGPAERENSAMAELFETAREMIELESLVALAEMLAGARQYIGNDSGVTHLSAAVGCPTVAIFGPTDAKVWAPLGAHVRVVERAGRDDESVMARVEEEILPQRR